MPRIRFVWLQCRCGAEHKVSIERLATGEPLACLSCGEALYAVAFSDALDAVRRYSEAVAELERRCVVDGDALRLKLSGGPTRTFRPRLPEE